MGQEKILVIDDEEIIRSLVSDVLGDAGYSVVTVATGEAGYEAAMTEDFDLIIIDLMLPGDDGLNIVEHIRKNDPDAVFIVITGDSSFENIRRAIRAGAFDFLPKPFDIEQISFAVKRALGARHLIRTNKKLMKDVSDQNRILEEKVAERTHKLSEAYEHLKKVNLRIITTLVSVIEAKDKYTRSHSENVAKYSVAVAAQLGLEAQEIDMLSTAARLHDIGKIGIYDAILHKPGKLTDEEYREIKQHPQKGEEILRPLDFLADAIALITQHHERYDGAGYPYGRKGNEIPIGARIMAVADSYDAMRSKRPYRERAMDKAEAIAEIKQYAGSQFDPEVVAAFLAVVDRVDP